LRLTALGLALAWSASSYSADITPTLRAGLSYTDNLYLDAVDEQSDLVLQLEPSVNVNHEADRVQVNLDYLMQAFWYSELSDGSIYHRYDLNVALEAIPDKLIVDVGGDRTQGIIDPRSRLPAGNLPISSNRVDRNEYYVAPRFESNFGRAARVNAQYRYAWVDYSSGGLQSNESQDVVFQMDNYRRSAGLTWALKYDWRNTDYESGYVWKNQSAAVELGVWMTDKLRVFGSSGRESPWLIPNDDSLSEDTLEAGFAYDDGERISAEFALGDRSYGKSWRGRLNFRIRRGSLDFSYNETPNTSGRTRYSGGSFTGDPEPEDGLSNPRGTERFISRRYNARLTLELRRTRLYFNIFQEDRTDRTDSTGLDLNDQAQVGGQFTATYEAGVRTSLRATAFYADRDFDIDDSAEVERYSLSLTYKLGAKSSIELRHRLNRQASAELMSNRNYTANTTSLIFTRDF
jgi:hypothetical protein